MASPILGLEPQPVQAFQATPQLVLYTQLLAMDAATLEARIAEELAANPALTMLDTYACADCGMERTAERCPVCERGWASPRAGASTDFGLSQLPEPSHRPTRADRIGAAARLLVPPEDRSLVSALIGALDDDGYCTMPLADLAALLEVDAIRLGRALEALRSTGHPAIAAADCRESLLLQLAALEDSPVRRLAAVIVRDWFDALGHARLGPIASALGVPLGEVVAARDEIRASLNPRPVAGLHEPLWPMPVPIRPDVAVSFASGSPSRFTVEVVDWPRTSVQLDPAFTTLAATPDRQADPSGRGMAPEGDDGDPTMTYATVTAHVRRGRSFVARLQDRNRTLERIAQAVVERQWAFVLYGAAFARPLTRADIASELGLHESTISRAIADKSVLLPSGRLVAFADFFQASLALHDALLRILADEDRPLSDTDLQAGLRDRGYRLARRTVAKYRRQLGIPTVAIRRAERPSTVASPTTDAQGEGAFA